MLDKNGYRPNVGIILLNQDNRVFWGKRIREQSWQFPQGGINPGENPEEAMYRELHEEVGLKPGDVSIIGRTRDWLHYNVPTRWVRREWRGHYRGQKQIWFMLRLLAEDSAIVLDAVDHPEFDAWRWSEYWSPLDAVIEFKRAVYLKALTELSTLADLPPAPTAILSGKLIRARTTPSRAPAPAPRPAGANGNGAAKQVPGTRAHSARKSAGRTSAAQGNGPKPAPARTANAKPASSRNAAPAKAGAKSRPPSPARTGTGGSARPAGSGKAAASRAAAQTGPKAGAARSDDRANRSTRAQAGERGAQRPAPKDAASRAAAPASARADNTPKRGSRDGAARPGKAPRERNAGTGAGAGAPAAARGKAAAGRQEAGSRKNKRNAQGAAGRKPDANGPRPSVARPTANPTPRRRKRPSA